MLNNKHSPSGRVFFSTDKKKKMYRDLIALITQNFSIHPDETVGTLEVTVIIDSLRYITFTILNKLRMQIFNCNSVLCAY